MSAVGGVPDWQEIQQWIGSQIAGQTGYAIGAGAHDDGPFQLASWASVIVAIKPTGGAVTVTVKQTITGAPASLELDTTFTAQAGATLFEAVVLSGDTVTLHLQGGGAGVTVDYALIPSNTTINAATVSGGSIPTGTILPFAGAAAPSGYVLCDGTHYDGTNATYTALWNLIGLTYGGTAQADFAVPDLRGRVPVGLGTNTAVNARGNSDGVAVANRRPQHRHTPHSHPGQRDGGQAASGFYLYHPASLGGVGNFEDTADGGSGVTTDSLDAPAYLVVNYMIAL